MRRLFWGLGNRSKGKWLLPQNHSVTEIERWWLASLYRSRKTRLERTKWYCFKAFGLLMSMSSLWAKFSTCCGEEQDSVLKWLKVIEVSAGPVPANSLPPPPHNSTQCNGVTLHTCQGTCKERSTPRGWPSVMPKQGHRAATEAVVRVAKKENFCSEETVFWVNTYPASQSSLCQGS